MTASTLTPDQAYALDIAKQLTLCGIPVFVAPADPSKPTGFRLPTKWQETPPDITIVERWQPGDALCAVMGHGLDLIDIDPRGAGPNPIDALVAALGGQFPTTYGTAATPSGGAHAFIRSIGIGSRDAVLPGVDIKAGVLGLTTSGGARKWSGSGFAFIAPTVKASKVTGELVPYRWIAPLDLDRLQSDGSEDRSGDALAALVARVRENGKAGVSQGGSNGSTAQNGSQAPNGLPANGSHVTVEQFMSGETEPDEGPWADVEAALAKGRNTGVFELAASLRGIGGLTLERAMEIMYETVWPYIDQEQGGHPFGTDEFEAVIRNVWQRYQDGEVERAEAAQVGPVVVNEAGVIEWQRPALARYFPSSGGFQAYTFGSDIVAMGPLAEGEDGRVWRWSGSVWRPERNVVRDRALWLLTDHYKKHMMGTVNDVVGYLSSEIRCDPVPHLIVFRNGALDWRNGQLLAHNPAVPVTVQLEVEWDPDATCPVFEKFLSEVLPADTIETAWELIGYLMYSGNPLHKAVMLVGKGRNGKGTFLHVLEQLLGTRNITSVSLHDLVDNRFASASLFGKLANIAGDIDAGFIENTAKFKGITGGDTISAEHKGKDRFDFKPWAVPVFSANKIPASADTTSGYLSRWLVLPFPNSFAGREDRGLEARLTTPEELRGIAAMAMRRLPGLLDRGQFTLSETMIEAQDDFERRVDQVRMWADEHAEFGPAVGEPFPFIPGTQLYAAYTGWAQSSGHKPVRAGEFYDRIEALGAWPHKYVGTRGFQRVRLRGNYGQPTGWVTPSEAPQPSVTEHSAPGISPDQATDDLDPGALGAISPPPEKLSDVRNVGQLLEGMAPALSAPDPAPAESAAPAGYELPAAVNRAGVVVSIRVDMAAGLLVGKPDLTVDVETTGYPIGHEHYALKTVQLGTAELAIVLDPDDPAQRAVIMEALDQAERLRAHSATADLVPLDHAGLLPMGAEEAWSKMHDTVIPAKLADPQSTGSDPALKQLAAHVLGDESVSPAADEARAAAFKAGKWLTEVKATTPVAKSGWAQIPASSETMLRYAASDVLDTALLAQRLPALPEDRHRRERAVEAVTARIAHQGLPLDGERVEQLHAEWTERKRASASVLKERWSVSNGASSTQIIAKAGEVGITLPLARKTGKPTAGKGALEPYANGYAGTPEHQQFAKDVLAHRTAVNRLGLFLDNYRAAVKRGDGRVRTTIYTLAADTGRMSSVRQNLQQVPREGGYRGCITADRGHLLVSADFAGVELRVAAALSGDQQLRAMIEQGINIHLEMARMVFADPTLTKADQRYYAVKRGDFGWLYGGGAETLAEHMGVTVPIAQNLIDTLGRMFPRLVDWTREVNAYVKAGGTTFTAYNGRVIHLNSPHSAPNYAIQGTARELLVDAILRWDVDADLRLGGQPIVLPVHDEIVTQVPEYLAEQATELLVRCMTSELYGVPIVAEPSEPSFAWSDSV
jgi:P4 family phage/plasmid primase-like protien